MRTLVILTAILLSVYTADAGTGNYKKSTLKSLNKMTLTEIYLDQVSQIFVNAPYAAFTLFGRDSSNYDAVIINSKLPIPSTEYFNNKRTAVTVESVKYADITKQGMVELIPYADKKDIIESIMYLQKVNDAIKTQMKKSKFFMQKLMY